MPTVTQHTLECLSVFVNNENTKSSAIKLAVQANVTDRLNTLKDLYKDDNKMIKAINGLYFHFAKSIGDVANSIHKTSLVSNLVK